VVVDDRKQRREPWTTRGLLLVMAVAGIVGLTIAFRALHASYGG
jgi:hypothetical protein